MTTDAGVGALDDGPAARHHLVVLGVEVDHGGVPGRRQISIDDLRWAASPGGQGHRGWPGSAAPD